MTTTENKVKKVIEEVFGTELENSIVKSICEKMDEENLLKPAFCVSPGEILFAIDKENESKLIELCESEEYYLKERLENGSMIFEGRAGKNNGTNKFVIGMYLFRNLDFTKNLTEWKWIDGGEEEDLLEQFREEGFIE